MLSLKSIQLHGSLASKYGSKPLSFAVGSGLQTLRTLADVFEDFQTDLEALGDVQMFVKSKRKMKAMKVNQLNKPFTNVHEIHIVPKGAAAGVEIAAAYLAVAATSTTAIVVGTIINIAFSLALSFVVSMLVPAASAGGSTTDIPSRIFSSAALYTGPGGAQPIVYGRVLLNGTQIGQAITTQDIALDA